MPILSDTFDSYAGGEWSVRYPREGIMELFDVRVDEQVRRRGIGSEMMEDAKEYAKRHAATLTAHVSPGNTAAHRFYEKNGFKAVAVVYQVD